MKNNCAFCVQSTIFTENVPFYMTIDIRYGDVLEINRDRLIAENLNSFQVSL